MDNTNITTFCRTIRQRSTENEKSILLLYENQLYSNIVSILRQELDSMVRVLYLLSIEDKPYRDDLIKACINGNKWTNKDNKSKITDKQMIEVQINYTDGLSWFISLDVPLFIFHTFMIG